MADSAASERRRRPEPAGRGTLRDEQRRLTRRRLADAAVELFEEIGYAGVTAEGIAKRAGANRATFYLHYASKADVVLEVMDAMHEDVLAILAPAGTMEEPSHAEVRAWLAGVLGFFEANRAIVDAHHQAVGVEPRVAQRWWSGYQQMADSLPGLWDDERSRMRLVSALVGMERMYWYDVVAGAPVERELLLDALADEWQALLGGRPADGPRSGVTRAGRASQRPA
jgi:AcrR family transcriptional regulator